jgi:two-component system chemotaxis sensor kinase CheA
MSNPFEGLLGDFTLDAKERVSRVEEILLEIRETNKEDRKVLLDEAKRELHTLKGNAGMMGLKKLQGLAHEMEDDIVSFDTDDINLQNIFTKLDQFILSLEEMQSGSKDEKETDASDLNRSEEEKGSVQVQGSIRVPFSALDELVDLLAEMVIFRNRLSDAVAKGARTGTSLQEWEEVERARESLGKTLDYIQDRIMRLRMVPLKTLFGHLHRIVHDECLREGKEASFQADGGGTPMDKALLEVASEALGHIVRNAVIHGIESPEVREKTGKNRKGKIILSAATQNDEVQIDVEDDGAGIDLKVLTEAARKEGIEVSSSEPLYSLLFSSGFSTREGIDISAGRGIGLAAAYTAVQRLGGMIEVISQYGAGSRFRLRLPLSVSITRGILLRADNEEYVLPLSSVIESLHFQPGDGHQINKARVFTWRGKVIPLLDLGFTFGTAEGMRDKGYVIIMESGDKQRGLIVDDISGVREIVVKGLDKIVGNPPGISGATILGDGRVLLIIDPPGLVSLTPFVEARYC